MEGPPDSEFKEPEDPCPQVADKLKVIPIFLVTNRKNWKKRNILLNMIGENGLLYEISLQ